MNINIPIIELIKIKNSREKQHVIPQYNSNNVPYIDKVEGNVYSLFDLYDQTLAQEPLHKGGGGHDIYNVGGSFRGHKYHTLNLSAACQSREEEEKKYRISNIISYMVLPQGS